MTTHRSGWVGSLVRRTKPIHLVAVFTIVTAALVYWLDTKHTRAAESLLVGLMLAVMALVLEVVREVVAVQDTITQRGPCELSYNESETLYELEHLEKLALAGHAGHCQVRAVWSAMQANDDLKAFLERQLKHVGEQLYTVDRWIDIDRIDKTTVLQHLHIAYPVMQAGRYKLHLAQNVRFGAMVVNEDAAAINFATNHAEDMIGISAADKLLAQRVRGFIDEIEGGIVLERPRGADATLRELQQRIEEYYVSCGRES